MNKEENPLVGALLDAEKNAWELFAELERRQLIVPGKTEKEVNNDVYTLAEELFGIKKFWHKRIVRSGKNTLLPYRENPPDLTLQEDDILFFDYGPVFEDWEADIGKTYVIGKDKEKHNLCRDTELAWHKGKQFFQQNPTCTGAEFYAFTKKMTEEMGYEYGNAHCGHLIGEFPHEKVQGEEIENYIHPDNHKSMAEGDTHGNPRHWIYEIHLIHQSKNFGGFFEQFLG